MKQFDEEVNIIDPTLTFVVYDNLFVLNHPLANPSSTTTEDVNASRRDPVVFQIRILVFDFN